MRNFKNFQDKLNFRPARIAIYPTVYSVHLVHEEERIAMTKFEIAKALN